MPLTTILFIAVALAMDAFAVSIASGITIKRLRLRHAFLVGGAFGLAQGVMPVLGWWLGQRAAPFLSAVDYWVAGGLLICIGAHMLFELHEMNKADQTSPLNLKTLFALAIATSIDAFAVGLSLSLLKTDIILPSLIIGVITFVMSFGGIYIGHASGHIFEKKLEIAGALLLIGMGLKICINGLIEQGDYFVDNPDIWFAFGLTLFAGLCTGIGSALAFFTKRTNKSFLSIALGFSAGVMIYVSMIEIFFKAKDALCAEQGDKLGYWITVLAFFTGMLLTALIDKLVPEFENPHEPHVIEDMTPAARDNYSGKLLRMGVFSALAISIHNFPEGLATFVAALKDPTLGLSIAVAIAIHNIPEGIAVSVPIYYATGSKKKAFGLSFASGLAEPIGALVGFTILAPFMSDTLFGILFAAVAGIMVFISLDELLPTAREYGEHHLSIYGLVAGMAVMALSLLMFA